MKFIADEKLVNLYRPYRLRSLFVPITHIRLTNFVYNDIRLKIAKTTESNQWFLLPCFKFIA
jgi:hypothetical protein